MLASGGEHRTLSALDLPVGTIPTGTKLNWLRWLLVWAGWVIATSPVMAQTTPSKQTFSILESEITAEVSPIPPESKSDSGIVAPPENPISADRPSAPSNDDRFADLFLDLPADSPTQPTAPSELEDLNSSQATDESLPAPRLAKAPLPTFNTDLGYAVLLAGPVHEAWLMRTELSQAGLKQVVVPDAPPVPVRELIPSSDGNRSGQLSGQFTGKNVQWISGYWAWIEDAHKHVWVSGLFRDIPPGRTWTAGVWTKTSGGYRWRSGYWADAAENQVANEVSSLTPPPALRDELPSLPPPTVDSFWIRGYWKLATASRGAGNDNSISPKMVSQYVWQPGYWATRSKEWIWQPAHIAETETGFVFVSGYWDYEPHFRGQAFACVVFDQTLTADQSYQPRYPVARPAATLLHLFAQDGSRHYYYGDYYDRRQQQLGYAAWYELGRSDLAATEACPLLGFYRWKYARVGVDFVASMNRFAAHFRGAPSIRPAAQVAVSPDLVKREGLAGQVNADTFDAIVRGNVGQRSVVMLQDRSASTAVVTASAANVSPAVSNPRPAASSPRAPQSNLAPRFRRR
jgi:hypothetical protein